MAALLRPSVEGDGWPAGPAGAAVVPGAPAGLAVDALPALEEVVDPVAGREVPRAPEPETTRPTDEGVDPERPPTDGSRTGGTLTGGGELTRGSEGGRIG